MPAQLCCYQVSLPTAPVFAKKDLLALDDTRPHCPAAEPTKRTPAFDKPRRDATIDRSILAQVSMHSLLVENRSKSAPILSIKHFDQVISSRLNRPEGDEDIRWVISPPQSVYATRTDVIRLQNSADVVNEKYATVLYRLFDERKTQILESCPKGGHLKRPESLSGSIIHLGSSYRPLTEASLAFFRQNRHALEPVTTKQRDEDSSLLILAPSGWEGKHQERTLSQVNRTLDASRPSAEMLPISSIRLAKASPREVYEPAYLMLLVLDLIRLCSHHCAGNSAPPRLTITDLKLEEIDLVVDAVCQALASQRSFSELIIEIVLSDYAPSAKAVKEGLQPLEDLYNGFVCARDPFLRCPSFSLVVRCGDDLRSLTVASMGHAAFYSSTHEDGIKMKVNVPAINFLWTAEGKREYFKR